jgi:hypothetical protein
MVAIGTFEWISFRIINKMPKHDICWYFSCDYNDYVAQFGFSCFNRCYFALVFAWRAL